MPIVSIYSNLVRKCVLHGPSRKKSRFYPAVRGSVLCFFELSRPDAGLSGWHIAQPEARRHHIPSDEAH